MGMVIKGQHGGGGDPGSNGMFCILTKGVDTQIYPGDKIAKN